MKDDLERELDGDTSNKKKFRTGTPGKTSNDVIFSETKGRQEGDLGRQVANYNKPKLLTTRKQILEERLRRLKEEEFKGGNK